MQPYFLPYIGYFQLINAVDKFIFYDDVNYIKGGWINRNNILINNEKNYFTLNLSKPSPNKLINEIKVGNNKNKILKTIKQNYSKAKYFNNAFPLVEEIFNSIHENCLISEIATLSVQKISLYLKIKTKFELSSKLYGHTKGIEKADRLIEICKSNYTDTYINPIGGIELYNKNYFNSKGINLFFFKNGKINYKQFNNNFIPNLSIIDVVMFNNPEKINEMLDNYELI